MFEQPPAKKENPLLLRSKMQLELANRYFGFGSGETRIKWIEKFSEEFGKIVKEDPALLERFEKNPEDALKEAEEKLYVRHGQESA